MLLGDTQLSSFFNSTSSTIIPATLLRYPLNDSGTLIDCCDGILCFYFGSFNNSSVMLWNPSIRKFKILPPLEHQLQLICIIYGFGYDSLTDTYKLVVVRCYEWDSSNRVSKIKVMLHTVGKDTWKTVEGFPSRLQRGMMSSKHGIFVTGAVNWFVRTNSTYSRVILSFDLGNESFKEFSPPDCGEVCGLTLGVLRDCLCILAHTDTLVIHVWLMKDYGNEDSWTKLFTLPYNLLGRQMPGSAYPLYISEHDQLLLKLENDKFTLNFEMEFFVYNSRDGTGKAHEVPSILGSNFVCGNNHVYIESLIAPDLSIAIAC